MKLSLTIAVLSCIIGCTSGNTESVAGTPDCNAHFDDSEWGQGYGEQVQFPASTPNMNLDTCVPIDGWYCCVSSAKYSPFSQ